MRTLVTAAVFLASFLGFGTATAGAASQWCESVTVYGSVPPPQAQGTCGYWSGSVICNYEHIGAWPQVMTYTVVCFPTPVSAPPAAGAAPF